MEFYGITLDKDVNAKTFRQSDNIRISYIVQCNIVQIKCRLKCPERCFYDTESDSVGFGLDLAVTVEILLCTACKCEYLLECP